MQQRTRGGRPQRRLRREIPAVATVIALAGTGLLATGSQAAENSGAPSVATAGQPAEPTQRELRERVAEAIAADAATKGSAAPAPRGAAKPKSAPGARIIGGKPASIASAPWMAQLYFADSQGSYFCGGAVVAPTKIVTAAHCVQGIDWARTGAVVTGTDRTPTDTGRTDPQGNPILDFHGGQVRGAYRQWNHARYDSATINNDVAVLTLTSPVKARPLPLVRSSDAALYRPGTDGKVYGWGRTSSTNPNSASDRLKVADADAQSDTACRTAYGSYFKAGTMYCAGKAPTGSDSTSETTCNGDSGGPLVVGGRLAGIVSWGDIDCSARGKYGVYAKASAFQAGIRARVNDTNWSGDDHTADLLARSGSTLYGWMSRGTGITRKYTYPNFGGVNLLVQADLDRDDYQDVVYRLPNGDVHWSYNATKTKIIAKGWRGHRQILVPGDLTGDELPDLMTVESSGKAYLYPGRGNGTFAARVLIGSGWSQFDMVRGHGDYNADGKADVLARGAGGKFYLYKGTGSAKTPLAPRTLLAASMKGMNALATTGDVNADGHPDLLTRDTAGKLWLYPGSGASTGNFGKRVLFGTGWKSYNLFG
ncbi:trypsin-like serine protease [Streptomyces sp. NPDC055078]